MIGLTKKMLAQLLGSRKLRKLTLTTLLVEVENLLNSPPIIRFTQDPESITPNHLLKLKCTFGPTIPGNFEDGEFERKI